MKIELEELKVSASALKTYESCPRKYYFSYIKKLPKKKWPHTELGNFVHNVLEAFHNQMRDNPLPASEWPGLLRSLCAKQLSENPLTPEQRASAKNMLATYLDKIRETGLPNVLFNEKGFSVKLPDNVLIRGFIDRIDREGDMLHIVDYKSGKSKHLDEFQLVIYALALMAEDPSITRVKGSYLALAEGCKTIPYSISKTDVDRCRDEIVKISNQIRSDQTWETRPTRLCNYCDFKEVCPAMAAEPPEWGSFSGGE